MHRGEPEGLPLPCDLALPDVLCDPNFDRVTQLAATIFGVPFAALMLIDGGERRLKSVHGFGDIPSRAVRELCELLSSASNDVLVSDLAGGFGVAGLPVPDEHEIRFLASAPLAGTQGQPIGALAVMGCSPRHDVGSVEVGILQGLAQMAVELVELRREQLSLLQRAQEITHLAHHDPLTELGNRRHLDRSLDRAIGSLRPQDQVILYCLDLDGFKRVNDSLGHGAGDLLLRDVTQRLRGQLRPGDSIARTGGDEFAIVQCGDRAVAEAASFASGVIAAVSRPYGLNGQVVRIGTSIGAAVGRHPKPSAVQLLSEADRALYRAKAAGRGRFALSDHGRGNGVVPRFAISRLRFDEAVGAPSGHGLPAKQPLQTSSH